MHLIQGINTTDGQPRSIVIDLSTWALSTVDYAHHEAHAGSSFYYHDVISMTASATQDYLLTVPDSTKWPHFGFEVDFNDGAGTTEIYEAGDRGGTSAQTTFNRNRNSTASATFTVHKGQSGGTTDGTRIFWKRGGAGKTSGGTSGTAEERIMKQNTKYILRLTNVSGATNNVSVVLRWYEHTNRT